MAYHCRQFSNPHIGLLLDRKLFANKFLIIILLRVGDRGISWLTP